MTNFSSLLSFTVGICFAALLAPLVPPHLQQYKDADSGFGMAAIRFIRVATTSSSQSLFNSLRSSITGASRISTTTTIRQVSTSTNNMSTTAFIDAVKARRSIYAIEKKSPVSDARIEEIVKDAILHTPSAFNSQTTRLVVLVKDDHDKFWEFVKEAIKAMIPAEQYAKSVVRLDGFKAGYGTILFLEDQIRIKSFQEKVALYADRFPDWSEHTSGMHQFVLWTALETEGLGCSLQHYNPLVNQKVQAEWNVPATWTLKAQLVFGTPTGAPNTKVFDPVEDRVFFHGK